MSKDDPAFPLANFEMRTDDESGKSYVCGVFTGGLTKRERAAIDMMAALIIRNGTAGTWEKYAGAAVCAADALIAELERTA